MTIFYEFEGKLYANITNRCPCSCVFCIRKNGDSVADNDSLWLEHEPSYEEIVKQTTDMKIRINTNGLVDFINPAFDSYKMRYIIDCISISLNAPDPESYLEVSRPKFGLPSFNSMLNFATTVKTIVPEVMFTVVDIIKPEQIEQCKELAEGLGIPLRVRHWVTDNESYT